MYCIIGYMYTLTTINVTLAIFANVFMIYNYCVRLMIRVLRGGQELKWNSVCCLSGSLRSLITLRYVGVVNGSGCGH